MQQPYEHGEVLRTQHLNPLFDAGRLLQFVLLDGVASTAPSPGCTLMLLQPLHAGNAVTQLAGILLLLRLVLLFLNTNKTSGSLMLNLEAVLEPSGTAAVLALVDWVFDSTSPATQ